MRIRYSRRRSTAAAIAAIAMVGAVAFAQPASGATAATADPSGATSNFAVGVDGFQFANYGTGTFSTNTPPIPAQTWTGADTFRLWGASQCSNANPTAANCVTSQFLAGYLESAGYTGASGAGISVDGQCFGMAMLSELLFNGNITPPQIDPTYGPKQATFTFPSASEPVGTKLQHELYFWWVAQLPMLNSYTPPITAYQELEKAFGSGGNPSQVPYVLSLSDHAITPVGVSPTSSQPGWASILVYDNNFPNQVRELWVNLTTNQFGYFGGGIGNLYGGTAPNQTGAAYLSLVPVSSTPDYKCAASGLCQVPGANPTFTALSAGVDSKTLDKGISMRVLSAGKADGRATKNRTVKKSTVRYASQGHAQALARVPHRVKEFTVELRDRGSKHAQSVSVAAASNGNSMATRQVTVPKRGVVRVNVNRETGAIRVLGARNVDFDGVADLGKYDYRIKFEVADRGRSGGGGWATTGRTEGLAKFRSTSTTTQRVKTTVTRSYAAKGGRVVRNAQSRWTTLAPGQVLSVWYGKWRPGTTLDIG